MQRAKVEVNNFGGGLITEINPLNFPPNASSDEVNMVLNKNGTRNRRFGFDLETSYAAIDSGITYQAGVDLGSSEFKWKNPGGYEEKEFMVVQIGNHLAVYDMDGETLSTSSIYSTTHDTSTYSATYSYAVVDGILVMVNGTHDVYRYTYDGTSITESTESILIRDLFGVDDSLQTIDGIQSRPTTLTDEHLYNLRNQTWAIPRRNANTETDQDPILSFFTATTTKYPSNTDNVNAAYYADPDDTDNRTIERFFATNLKANPLGTFEAPKGHFIIDALERGPSRETEEASLYARHTLSYTMAGGLPVDTTPGGPSVVGQYSGRFFYGGFLGTVTDADSKSPQLCSYLLFSRLIRDKSDINKCYQVNDPTSPKFSDLLDTDGGFIRLEGAFGIKGLVDIAGSLFVFAENGVWRVSGDADGGFTATAYKTEKLSEDGCIASGSIVVVEEMVYYWTKDAIYRLARNEYGQWLIANISRDTLQRFFNEISIHQKEVVKGSFDSFERSVRWIYGDQLDSGTQSKELVFNTLLEAFSPFTVNVSSNFLPRVLGVFEANPRLVFGSFEPDPRVSFSRETLYLVILATDPTIEYSFGAYKDVSFQDWGSIDTPVDTEAYLITGFLTAGDSMREKHIPYVTVHMEKTETGFTEDYVPIGASSCLFSTRWNWTNSDSSNKWSSPKQVYRHRRPFFPSDLNSFDDGNSIVTTRNKIRGLGKSVALKFTSQQGYDMKMVGWSHDLLVEDVD